MSYDAFFSSFGFRHRARIVRYRWQQKQIVDTFPRRLHRAALLVLVVFRLRSLRRFGGGRPLFRPLHIRAPSLTRGAGRCVGGRYTCG